MWQRIETQLRQVPSTKKSTPVAQLYEWDCLNNYVPWKDTEA